MPWAYAAFGCIAAPEIKSECCGQIWNCGDQALIEYVKLRIELLLKATNDGRQEERQRIKAVNQAEIDDGQEPYALVCESKTRLMAAMHLFLDLLFLSKRTIKPVAFILVQPLGVVWRIRQVEPGDDTHDDSRSRNTEEHNAPAFKAESTVHADQLCGKRCADHSRQRLCEIEQREDLVTMTRRHPGRQEQDCAGKEACFSNTKQEA